MSVYTLTASANCQRCDWSAEGDPAVVDKAADKHTRTAGHPTESAQYPAKEGT